MLVIVAFAGCSEGKGGQAEDDPFTGVDVGPIDEGKGVIRGVVVDQTIRPIAEATVAMQDGSQEVTTNQNGLFVLSNIEPGNHFLTVSKTGYSKVQQNVEVEAGVGEPPAVRVLLERLEGTEPYIIPDHYQGWVACEYLIGFDLRPCDFGTEHFGEPDSTVYFAIDPRQPEWVQMEIFWEHTQEFGKRMTMTMGACGDQYCSIYDEDAMLCQTWGPSSLWCKVGLEEVIRGGAGYGGQGINETALGHGKAAGIGLDMSADCQACTPEATPYCGDACGVGIILQQTFDAYVHTFYNFQPTADWLYLEDGKHEVPGG